MPTPSLVPEVSAVIATCNSAATVVATLDSIVRQSMDCVREIVVIDDASDDDSVRVVRNYPDSRIRVVELAVRQGVSNARNLGVQNAACDWIAFNDADDVWLDDKLERQHALLREHPDAIGCVGGNGRLHRNQRSQWSFRLGPVRWQPEDGPQPTEPPAFRPVLDGHAYIQSLLVKREVAAQVPFKLALHLMQDQDFLLRLSQLGKLVCVPGPVFLYRLGYSNTTAPGRMRARDFLANRAYLDAMAIAVYGKHPQPDAAEFLAHFSPDTRALEAFDMSQRFRLFNTTWVNRGLLPATGTLVPIMFRHPRQSWQFLKARFTRWPK